MSSSPPESDCSVSSTTTLAADASMLPSGMLARTFGSPTAASGQNVTGERRTADFPFATLAADGSHGAADNVFLRMNFTGGDGMGALSPWLSSLPSVEAQPGAGAGAGAGATTGAGATLSAANVTPPVVAAAAAPESGSSAAKNSGGSSDSCESDDYDDGDDGGDMSNDCSTQGDRPATQDADDTRPSSTVNDCVICTEEKASGNHFGAMTCEACKAFFRRTVRRNRSYSCRMDRTCEIDKETRNHCQYCRLQKCLRKGMKKESVQYGRGPTVRAGESMPKSIDDLLRRCPTATQAAPMPAISDLYEMDFFHVLPTEDASVTVKHMMDAERRSKERTRLPAFPSNLASSLDEVVLAFRALFLDVINWAKLLPEFDDLGSPKHQADSLRVCWMDHITLTLATQAQPGDRTDAIFLNAQHYISRTDCFDKELGLLIGRLIDELVIPFRAMNLSDFEKACIRGILFFCPEKHFGEMELSKRMNFYQEALMGKLMDQCTIALNHRKANRYGKLLLRVSALQTVSAELFRYFMLHDTTFFNARDDGRNGGSSYGVNTTLNTMLLLPMNGESR